MIFQGTRDRPVSFYRAQLKHYGLKDMKTREAAKRALQRGIAAAPEHQLLVPQSVLKIEQDLTMYWEDANAVAEEEEREANLRREEEVKTAAAKRTAETEAIYDSIMGNHVSRGKKVQKVSPNAIPRRIPFSNSHPYY